MAWTNPKTWTSEPLTSSDLNTEVRDNLNALKNPPSASIVSDESANYSTTSTSFVDVDSTKLNLTITTTGGDVLVHFHGLLAGSGGRTNLDVTVDGVRICGDDGIVRVDSTTQNVCFTWLVSGLSAGAHTFKLQWRINAGTATLYAGAGTASFDLHPQFWVREVS